jgi:hypothetical protein
MAETPSDVFRIRGNELDWVDAGDEVIALDHRSGRYLSSNATGRALWHLLSNGATRGELVNHLVTHFDVTSERAAEDVDAFLGHLEGAGLLATG